MFTSPHPSSPWATLDRAALFYAASPASSYASDDNDDATAAAFRTPAQKPARKVDEVDYFSFRPHGIRSPYLPESYGQIDQEGVFHLDDDDARSETSSFSSTSTAVDDWPDSPQDALGAVFEDDDDDDVSAFSPVYIERVRSFSSSASSSSASSVQTPPPVTEAKAPAAGPRKRHSTAFALKVVGQARRRDSFESVALAQWANGGKADVRPDTPYPFIAESPDGAVTTLFNWRRE